MDNNTMTGRKTFRPSKRKLIQLYSALLHNAHLKGFIDGEIYQGNAKYACVPGFNCYSCPGAVGACPLGSLQNALASTGHRAGWYVFGIIMLYGVILGRTICGWLCPIGLIQELLHKVPTFKIKKNPVTRALTWLKYGFLAIFVIAIPLWYGLKDDIPVPGFCKYICPAGTLGAIGLLSNPNNADLFSMLGILFTSKFTIMLIIGLACVFCYRSFCRFLCPLGAIYGLFNRFCLVGVQVDEDCCNGCGACVRNCGMDIRHVGDHECIHCGKCVDICAQKAISLKAFGKVLKAPSDTLSEEETVRCRKNSRIAWGIALCVLCFALVWFNFLDPAVRAETKQEAAPIQQDGISVGSEVGMRLEDFTLTCLDGTEFTLADTRGKIVFINLWATYCAPCVKELPYFDELYREHEGEIAVLAVHSSNVTDDPAKFLAGKGWEIPFAVDTEDDLVWNVVDGSSTLPQTIVLDRDGVVIYNQKGAVSSAMLTALYEQASAGITGNGVTGTGDTGTGNTGAGTTETGVTGASAEESAETYLVLVTDEEGMPVPGVMVQFCSDVTCTNGETDAAGMASFDFGPGEYTVHIFSVLEGYASDDTEYKAPSTPGTLTVVLKAEAHEEQEEEGAVDVPQIGFHFVKPEKYKDLKGSLSMSGGFPDKKLLVVDLEYYAVSPEQSSEYSEYCDAYVDAYLKDEELPVPPDPSWMSHYEYAVLYSILAVPDGGGEEELRTLLKQYNYPYYDEFAWLEEVWSDGDTTFYIGQYEFTESRIDKYREYMGDFFEEFEDLYRDREAFLSAVTLRAPIWPGELSIGDVLRFETTDLDGNPVSSEELFAQSKVTMINLWGTWCSPCKRELPELGVMAKEFEAQGCRIVGICDDAYKEGIPETAKALLQDAGCEYLNLTGTPELVQMFHTTSFPTTCFVDSEGMLLLNPIFGAYPDQYREALEEALFIVDAASGEDQSDN